MPSDQSQLIDADQRLTSNALRALQRQKLDAMLREVRAHNPFYRQKLADIEFDALKDPLERLPLTTRAQLEADQLAHPPYGTNLTYPLAQYSRYHQTSGSGGRPMRWLDTAQSWLWFQRCWRIIFDAAGVTADDRIFFAFSFGPFVGFWAAFAGANALGALCIPAGGLSTNARLRMLLDNAATVVCCTPTYALHMAQTAVEQKIDLAGSSVRALIVAGEPGGSIPSTRQRIESAWGARVYDHTGMTEIGALAFECEPRRGEGVHIIESEFIPEVIDPQTLQPVADGEPGELVLTNLGRWGSPLIRYRTGDRVRLTRGLCACGRHFARLEGGILGRIDEMFIVRGNNIFPSAVEAVLRRFDELAEFRCTIHDNGALTQVTIEVEPQPASASAEAAAALCLRVQNAVQESLNFRATVIGAAPGTLPRFDLKARRFVRRTTNNAD
ncbi:MAG TPA: AMP-binding protein [Humisphaera sp.]|nr:AMP-binding protein [Humisphaera sp.]